MVRKLKENNDAARSSEPSKHVFHSASHEIASHQPFSQPYIPTSISTMSYQVTRRCKVLIWLESG